MTDISNRRSGADTNQRNNSTHLYKVGESVRLKGGFVQRPTASGTYKVTATLPPEGAFPQYRVRNDDERHERVVSQDNLERVRSHSGSERDKLISKTFGKA